MFEHDEIVRLLAAEYGEVAQQEADMRLAAEALEIARRWLSSSEPPFTVIDRLSDEIGRATQKTLRDSLGRLRQKYRDRFAEVQSAKVREAASRSKDDAHRLLRTYVAESLTEFDAGHAIALLRAAKGLGDDVDRGLAEHIAAIERLAHAEWAASYDLVRHLAEDPDVPPGLRGKLMVIQASILLYMFDKPSSARRRLQEAESLEPDVRWFCAMAGVEVARGSFDKAQALLESAAKPSPAGSIAMLELARLELRRDRLEQAEAWFDRALSERPGSSDLYRALVLLYARPATFQESRSQIEELTELAMVLDPESAAYTARQTSFTYEQNGLSEEARGWAERAAKLDPDPARCQLHDGNLAYQRHHELQAVEAYSKAIAASPRYTEAHRCRAILLTSLKRYDEALRDWETLKSICKDSDVESAVGIAEVRVHAGAFEEALDLLLRALAQEPDRTSLLGSLQWLATRWADATGDVEPGLRVLGRVLELRPDYAADSQNFQGNLCFQHGRHEEALEHYRQAVALRPRDALFRENLAGAARELGLLDEAAAAIRVAAELGADVTHSRVLLENTRGNIAFRDGDYAAAVAAYRRAAEAAPGDSVIANNLDAAKTHLRESGSSA